MYIDIVNLLSEIAEEVNPTGTFYHGRVSDANLAIERKPLPQIHLYPFKITHPVTNGVDNVPNILMAFIFQDSPNSSDEDRTEIINQADIMQRKFENWLISRDVQYSNYEAEPFYKQFNGITSGMFIRFQLQVKTNPCAL